MQHVHIPLLKSNFLLSIKCHFMITYLVFTYLFWFSVSFKLSRNLLSCRRTLLRMISNQFKIFTFHWKQKNSYSSLKWDLYLSTQCEYYARSCLLESLKINCWQTVFNTLQQFSLQRIDWIWLQCIENNWIYIVN